MVVQIASNLLDKSVQSVSGGDADICPRNLVLVVVQTLRLSDVDELV